MLDIGCRPEDLVVSVLPVPPVTIRPSVDMDGASNEDDITMKLMVGGCADLYVIRVPYGPGDQTG